MYVCTVSSWCGTRARSSAVLEVEPREMPSVELYPGPHQKVPRGGSVMVQCRWGDLGSLSHVIIIISGQ